MAAIEQMINNVDTKNQPGYVLEYRQRILSKARVQVNNGAIVLNIGCGEGWDNLDFAKDARMAVGIDIASSAVWNNIQNQKTRFITSDARQLPFKNSLFDTVFIKDVLHHLDSPVKVLEEIKRVTRHNGIIYFIESNRYNPISYLHMTLLRGHDHLSQGRFKKIIKAVFDEYQLINTETHVFPFRSARLRNLLYRIEDFIEDIKFFRGLVSYNIAIARKKE